jgi:hypothetical protein
MFEHGTVGYELEATAWYVGVSHKSDRAAEYH